MTTISAQTILRSQHSQRPDKILSTLLLTYPRFIHAEFMTHRQLSRNASSSRAIPFKKQLEAMLDNPAVPLFWGQNQKGMQAGEPVDADTRRTAEAEWIAGMYQAVETAESLHSLGLHKQIVNRIIEPYTHIKVLVSATEWSNFLALRDHPDAEPHIQLLAQEIRKELDREDNIQTLEPGQWHLPFVGPVHEIMTQRLTVSDFIKKSVACCASTSYKTVDGFDMTFERAIALHDKLVGSTPLHASPAEHVAYADEYDSAKLLFDQNPWKEPKIHGNFEGFVQYRKTLPGECL